MQKREKKEELKQKKKKTIANAAAGMIYNL